MKIYFYLLIILIGVTNITEAQNKKSFLKEGNKLFSDSSYNASEIKYRKSLEKDQDYFSASYNLANSIYKQERFDESSSLYESLQDNARNNHELSQIYHNKGNSLMKQQKTDLAIKAYKDALRENPNDEDTRFNLAYAKKIKQKEEENKDKENKDEENKEQENKEKKDQEKKDEKNKEQENKDEENKEQENKEKKDQMSKEDAEKMLEALEQKEKELQEKLQKKKVKGKKIKILKDW
jgi:Ca-activated chloride channel family protein